MNKYETIIIVNPDIESEDVESITEDVQNLISGSGGTVTKVDKWGKRRLAYEVKGNRAGIYVLISFEAEPEFIQRLARYYGLTEQIIKYMTVRPEDLPEPVEEQEEQVPEDESKDEGKEEEQEAEEDDEEGEKE